MGTPSFQGFIQYMKQHENVSEVQLGKTDEKDRVLHYELFAFSWGPIILFEWD